MIIQTENNKNFTFDYKYMEDKDTYELYIINPDTYEKMGYISYKQYKDTFWINIFQTYPKYQHKGIGYALLKCLDYLAYIENISKIEGKFLPLNEFAKPLYDKCGYKLEEKNNSTIIYKNINKYEIEKHVLPNIFTSNTFKQQNFEL